MESAKTIILSNKTNKNFKAILNLNSARGSIKFFNGYLQNKNYALGIKQDGNVLKVPLVLDNNNSEFDFLQKVDLKKEVVCAVVDVTNAFCPELVLSGSLNTVSENNKIEDAFVVKKPEDTSQLYTEDSDEEIENIVEKNIQEDMNSVYFDTCSNCKYRKAFYEDGVSCNETCACASSKKHSTAEISSLQLQSTENSSNLSNEIEQFGGKDEEQKNTVQEENQSFYMQVKPQIDALFEKYEEEEVLQNILPNSKWVKVRYDDGEEYYVLGLIFDESNQIVNYICYGVPSFDYENPPEDIKEYAQWLPIDPNNNSNGGYWIVYQKGLNGETVIVNYV